MSSTCAAQVKVRIKVTLRLTVNQSISLCVEPHLGLMTGYLFLFGSYGLVNIENVNLRGYKSNETVSNKVRYVSN
jgi:hypothetical protein